MENTESILQGSTDVEKGAYLGAIASIATADRQATAEEIEYLSALADSAGLSTQQKQAVMKAANEISDEDLLRCLDVLKNSELKYSLITDVIAFGKSDNNYTEEEQKSVQKMASYLGVNQQQFSLLDNFTEKAKASAATNTDTTSADESQANNFFGLKDKLQSAGINGSSLLKGLLSIAAPMVLAKMVTGGLNRGRSTGGGMFGGGGGMFGGGGMLPGGSGMFGGLGSIFSMLNGNRGFRSSGGLLSRILRGGF